MDLKIILFLFCFYISGAGAQVIADAGPDRQACVNDTFKVTGAGLNAGDTGSYQWTDLDIGILSNKQVLVKLFSSGGIHTIELKVTRVHNNITYTDRDSFLLYVYGLPQIKLPPMDTVCSGSGLLQLKSNNYAYNDTNGKWSGPFITGSMFDPSKSPQTKQYEGPYKMVFKYTHPFTHCSDEAFYFRVVQSGPVVMIKNPNPYQQCEGKVFHLNAAVKFAASKTWTTAGDGMIITPKKDSTAYRHGIQDTVSGTTVLTITTDPEGVCPSASKDVTLVIELYPIFSMPPHFVSCEPAVIDFSSTVYKPAASGNLRYSWSFGNGDSLSYSKVSSPQQVAYPISKSGWYDVTLKVHNQWGSGAGQECTTIKDSLNYVRVLPQPHPGFSSDPAIYTTVDYPTFNFTNETTIGWGNMLHQWYFDVQHNLNDTSSKVSPSHTYPADTASYWVRLVSAFQYYDPVLQASFSCWDSVGEPRTIGPSALSNMVICTLVQNNSVNIRLPFSGELMVVDALGRVMGSRNAKAAGVEHYDITDWEQGPYFFVLENGKARKVAKFTKYW